MWIIEIPQHRNGMAPPVLYGDIPEEAIEFTGPETLSSGFQHTAILFRIERMNGQVLVQLAGQRSFTP
jgi:hypothetical protein